MLIIRKYLVWQKMMTLYSWIHLMIVCLVIMVMKHTNTDLEKMNVKVVQEIE